MSPVAFTAPKTSDPIVQRFIDHMRLRNLRKTTIYGRAQAVARLSEWAAGPVLYLTEQQLRDWQSWYGDRVAPETLRFATSHLREFYAWVQLEGYRTDNPSSRLVMPKLHRRLPRPIREDHLDGALESADVIVRAILGLAAFAGLRSMEIAQLDWADVDLEESPARIRVEDGKGGESRSLPLSAGLIEILQALPGPHLRGPVIPREVRTAWVQHVDQDQQQGQPPSPSSSRPETLHQLRHRFATVTYRSSRDLRAVQDLLGHASPMTTAIYAAASDEVARDAVEAAGNVGGAR